jgi:hypothetical protein
MKITIDVDEDRRLFTIRFDGLSSLYDGSAATSRGKYESFDADPRAEKLASAMKEILWIMNAHFLSECHSKRV